MSGDVHVRFCEGLGVRFPQATRLVLLCRSEEAARAVLSQVKRWTDKAGLTLHPDKTRIVDATVQGGFDFLGYHFERDRCWPRKKSLMALKDAIRSKTRRTHGHSLETNIKDVNRTLCGWFHYFRRSRPWVFQQLDRWVRMRLRSILRKRHKGSGRGRGMDHIRWPNAYFAERGLFSLTAAYESLSQSSRR